MFHVKNILGTILGTILGIITICVLEKVLGIILIYFQISSNKKYRMHHDSIYTLSEYITFFDGYVII